QEQGGDNQPDMKNEEDRGIKGLGPPAHGIVRHQPVDDGAQRPLEAQARMSPVGHPVQLPVKALDVTHHPKSQPDEKDPEGQPQQGAGDELIQLWHAQVLPKAAPRPSVLMDLLFLVPAGEEEPEAQNTQERRPHQDISCPFGVDQEVKQGIEMVCHGMVPQCPKVWGWRWSLCSVNSGPASSSPSWGTCCR